MVEVTVAGAVAAGLLSFLSPCVLPLAPAYLSYISGVSVDTLRHEHSASVRWRAASQSLWFVGGFSLVFILLGASATLLGQWLLGHLDIFGKVAGVIIFVFGLHYTGIIRIPWLMMDAHFDTSKVKAVSGVGALLLGASFAFGWTPCVGPILGAILSLAGAQQDLLHGIELLAAYSLGLGVPFMVAALMTDQFLRWSRGFRQYLHVVEIVSGIMLMIVGAMFFLGSFSIFSGWLLEYAPFLGQIEERIAGL